MPAPKFSETQLDALSGGVIIEHHPDQTTTIEDQAGYLLQLDPSPHTMPAADVDTRLQENMEKSPFWH